MGIFVVMLLILEVHGRNQYYSNSDFARMRVHGRRQFPHMHQAYPVVPHQVGFEPVGISAYPGPVPTWNQQQPVYPSLYGVSKPYYYSSFNEMKPSHQKGYTPDNWQPNPYYPCFEPNTIQCILYIAMHSPLFHHAETTQEGERTAVEHIEDEKEEGDEKHQSTEEPLYENHHEQENGNHPLTHKKVNKMEEVTKEVDEQIPAVTEEPLECGEKPHEDISSEFNPDSTPKDSEDEENLSDDESEIEEEKIIKDTNSNEGASLETTVYYDENNDYVPTEKSIEYIESKNQKKDGHHKKQKIEKEAEVHKKSHEVGESVSSNINHRYKTKKIHDSKKQSQLNHKFDSHEETRQEEENINTKVTNSEGRTKGQGRTKKKSSIGNNQMKETVNMSAESLKDDGADIKYSNTHKNKKDQSHTKKKEMVDEDQYEVPSSLKDKEKHSRKRKSERKSSKYTR